MGFSGFRDPQSVAHRGHAIRTCIVCAGETYSRQLRRACLISVQLGRRSLPPRRYTTRVRRSGAGRSCWQTQAGTRIGSLALGWKERGGRVQGRLELPRGHGRAPHEQRAERRRLDAARCKRSSGRRRGRRATPRGARRQGAPRPGSSSRRHWRAGTPPLGARSRSSSSLIRTKRGRGDGRAVRGGALNFVRDRL
jgi:hypothetical protein